MLINRRKLITGAAACAAFASISEEASALPNDPGYPGNAGIGGVNQDYLTQINAPGMWTLGKATGATPIFDFGNTGFDTTHPDLQFVAKYNSIDGSTNVMDTNGHGTKCFSIMSSISNNGVGLCSVGQGSAICVKTRNASGNASSASLAAGTNWIISNYAFGVINMSFLPETGKADQRAMSQAFVAAGFLCVVSAGDNNNSFNVQPFFDGLPCLIVGGVDINDARWVESGVIGSTNSSNVNIAAPSGSATTANSWFLTADLVSAGSYSSGSRGTSFSAPVVADVMRCCWDANPALKAADLVRIATDPDNGDPTTGFSGQIIGPVRRINAAKCISKAINYGPPRPYSLPWL